MDDRSKLDMKMNQLKPKTKAETMEFVSSMAEQMVKAQEMSNDKLADAVCEIWKDLDMSTWESALLSEVMSRLMGFMQCIAPQPPEETHSFEPILNTNGFNAMSKDGEFLAVLFAPSSQAIPTKLTTKWFWVDSQSLSTGDGKINDKKI